MIYDYITVHFETPVQRNLVVAPKDGYTNLCDRQEAVKIELPKKENYTDRIEEAKRKLERIDKKLGVDKK